MNALFNISYGLYILTAKTDKYNGCVINTLMQVTSNPNRISITVNKNNYTTQMIEETGEFNVSVLDKTLNFDLIKRFGFSTSKNTNKFDNFYDFKLAQNKIPYITKHTNSYFSAKVVDKLDVGTHIIFVADVLESTVILNNESVTYSYYQQNIKPKPENTNKQSYVCKVCGYVHIGDELPDNFVCPICKHGVEAFEKQTTQANITTKKKYICSTCGYIEESDTPIDTCIICGAKMIEQ